MGNRLYDKIFNLTEARDQLLKYSVQRELTTEERSHIGEIYTFAAESKKCELREDCLDIIKYRLWRM